MNRLIPIRKIKSLFLLHSSAQTNIRATARLLRLSRLTAKKYLADITKFHASALPYERSLNDYLAHLKTSSPPRKKKTHKLFAIYPDVIRNMEESGTTRLTEWRKYRDANPDGYGYTQFTEKLLEYCKENRVKIRRSSRNGFKLNSSSDYEVLIKWKRSKDKWKWERATALLGTLERKSLLELSKKIERGRKKLKAWIRKYSAEGLDALNRKTHQVDEKTLEFIRSKKEKLIKLLHEPPKLHGINRASWSLKTLSKVFQKVHKISLAPTTISEYFKREGFRFVKARKVLTSSDPKYREKLIAITRILSRLKANEKFFSVDEFGPFSIKIKGGRSYVKKGEIKTYPQRQFSKGKLICTAALELSENQITHFYSDKKDTAEMIRLLDLLISKYSGQEKIYFSWDAASWHASKKLYERIEEINTKAKIDNNTPEVELAPLPACAQFLNVIESVFSGLARAIIHNSNYDSVEECKRAIDQYFSDRNQFFQANPKRAGNKIWGKERNAAVFDETKNFKDLTWR